MQLCTEQVDNSGPNNKVYLELYSRVVTAALCSAADDVERAGQDPTAAVVDGKVVERPVKVNRRRSKTYRHGGSIKQF